MPEWHRLLLVWLDASPADFEGGARRFPPLANPESQVALTSVPIGHLAKREHSPPAPPPTAAARVPGSFHAFRGLPAPVPGTGTTGLRPPHT